MQIVSEGTPLISMVGATLRLGNSWVVSDVDWCLRRGENWVVWGANGAGKSTLARALQGRVPVVRGRIVHHYLEDGSSPAAAGGTALVSSDQYHQLIQREQLLDEMRAFSGRVDQTTTVADLLEISPRTPSDAAAGRGARIGSLLDVEVTAKPLSTLSSGEIRKVLIARAVMRAPCLLILDEPFDGLDQASRKQCTQILERLHATGTQMVLVTHRLREIPFFFDRLLHIDHGRVIWQGRLAAFLPSPATRTRRPQGFDRSPASADTAQNGSDRTHLIRMRAVTVRYSSTIVLDHIDWTVREGEHWGVVGPNGAGKTTLLNLITGDNLQGYANALELFGRCKGAGDSLWQIRHHIGLVSDVQQARFQRRMTGLDVVCSGFFDSIGLYRSCSTDQQRCARIWIERFELTDLADRNMTALSFGQQRMLLLARAMVKTPRLLILDEPCNGLDRVNRQRLHTMVDRIADDGGTTTLYVTHQAEEMPACITHRLCLAAGKVVSAGPVRFL